MSEYGDTMHVLIARSLFYTLMNLYIDFNFPSLCFTHLSLFTYITKKERDVDTEISCYGVAMLFLP